MSAIHETTGNYESLLGAKFVDFVSTHSSPVPAEFNGFEARQSYYRLNLLDSLIPINGVEFSVRDTQTSDQIFYGYIIKILFDNEVLFYVSYSEDTLWQDQPFEVGIGDIGDYAITGDPESSAEKMLAQLSSIEEAGLLTPIARISPEEFRYFKDNP
jgi:hypothetical protein